MKRALCFSLLIAVAASLPGQAPETGSPPFTIAISGPAQPVAEGAEIRVHILLTNVSAQPVQVKRSPSDELAEFFYTVRVWDEHDNEVKLTDYGSAARARRYQGSQTLKLVPPGGQEEEYSVLSKQFDMSAPGEYKIQLERVVSRDPKDGTFWAATIQDRAFEIVKSNMITVIVAP
jgi:hypothetical protein